MTFLEEIRTWDWDDVDRGSAWVMQKNIRSVTEAWAQCWNPDWMRQLLVRRGVTPDQVKLRLWACDCAERVLPIFERAFPNDGRPRVAVDVARRYAMGEATRKELEAAVAAAQTAQRDAHDHNAGLSVHYAVGGAAGGNAGASDVRDDTVHALGLEIGSGLISLVDKDQGGSLSDRIAEMRQKLVQDQGLKVPSIRIRDNLRLGPEAYSVRIWGREVDKGQLTKANDHLGPSVADLAAVLTDHLAEIVRSHALMLLNPPAGLKMVEVEGELQETDEFMGMAWSVARDAANAAAWDGQGNYDPDVWSASGKAAREWEAERLRTYFLDPFSR